jgi:hypothetical protein
MSIALDVLTTIGGAGTAGITEELLRAFVKTIKSDKEKEEFIKKLPDVNSISKQETIRKLTKALEDKKLVLVLGAGVSMGFGLPNWDTLLQKLMITTIEQEQNVSTVLSKLFSNIFAPSPLIAGRYLQKHYESKSLSFEENVRKILYDQLDIEKPSPLMDEIVNICVAPGNSPTLDSIITYNFDDILEQRLSKVGVPVPYKSIYGIGMNPGKHLQIYHVHGFLPHKGKISENNQITFGESIYHKQYMDIYSWNNIVQINKFRDFNCLFIGSSLTDPNIRRLLDIARRQKGDKDEFHYVFKTRYKEDAVKKRLKDLLDRNKELFNEKVLAELDFDDTVKFLIDIIQRFEESDTASFGVKTIWVDDFSEIPETLKEVRIKVQ